jgi:hypothetical protein
MAICVQTFEVLKMIRGAAVGVVHETSIDLLSTVATED